MIKSLDWEFLEDLIIELDICRPDDGIDSFYDIYKDIIEQYLYNLEIQDDAKDFIIEKIYCNYLDTRIDLSTDDFLEKFPEHEDRREELENILYT